MKASTRALATFALLASSALAAPPPSSQSHRKDSDNKCSATSLLPCTCPNGTTYRESVTFSVIGAAANDVKDVISSYFKPSWLGVTPYSTIGTDNVVGAIRTSKLPTLVGIYDITELLTRYDEDPKFGSFVQKFEQEDKTVPVLYHNGTGEFGGYWVTLSAQYIFQYETAITWSVYACETGYPRNFAHFHEEALKNATDILTKADKIKGKNVDPYSVQTFLNGS
ncbi:MAG: hypothetical protein M1835_000147 [Candelina submexicana]|nr:MAG: hypothetical protein M1835_000147 [Candelina submexicana]